ncbi:MAG: hypothetical protein ABIJ39_05730 [Chloroflexota bacterium]
MSIIYLALAIALQAIGFYGYKRKKWKLNIYISLFTILTCELVAMGFMPYFYPNADIVKTIRVLGIVAVVLIPIAYLLTKYIRVPE